MSSDNQKVHTLLVKVDKHIYPRLHEQLEQLDKRRSRGKTAMILSAANLGLFIQDLAASGKSLNQILEMTGVSTKPAKVTAAKEKPAATTTATAPLKVDDGNSLAHFEME